MVSIRKIPCPCGRGHVIITTLEPDHAFADRRRWTEADLSCPNCEAKYRIVSEFGTRFIAPISEVIQKDKAIRLADEKWKALNDSLAVQQLQEKVATYLNSLPSKAATWRELHRYGLVRESQGNFTKNWYGAERWLRVNFGDHSIRRFTRLISFDDSALQKLLDEAEEADERSRIKLTRVREL